MAANSLYPGFTKIIYGTGSSPHTMILPMTPDGGINIGFDPMVTTRTTSVLWSTYVATFINLLKPFFQSVTDFSVAEYWRMEEIDSDPQFVYGINPAISGTNAGTNTSMSQTVITFRTYNGGIYKLYLMEAVATVNQVVTAPFPAGITKTLTDHMIGTQCAIMGRDGGFLLAPLRSIGKTNDALRKKILLNT